MNTNNNKDNVGAPSSIIIDAELHQENNRWTRTSLEPSMDLNSSINSSNHHTPSPHTSGRSWTSSLSSQRSIHSISSSRHGLRRTSIELEEKLQLAGKLSRDAAAHQPQTRPSCSASTLLVRRGLQKNSAHHHHHHPGAKTTQTRNKNAFLSRPQTLVTTDRRSSSSLRGLQKNNMSNRQRPARTLNAEEAQVSESTLTAFRGLEKNRTSRPRGNDDEIEDEIDIEDEIEVPKNEMDGTEETMGTTEDSVDEEEIVIAPIPIPSSSSSPAEEEEIVIDPEVGLPPSVLVPADIMESNDDLVEAMPVVEEDDPNPQAISQAFQVDREELEKRIIKEQKEQECRRIGYAIIVSSLLILGLSLGFGLDKGQVQMSRENERAATLAPSPVPSSAPTGILDDFLNSLPSYSIPSLNDPNSPQSKALGWLQENHDTILRFQNLTEIPQWRKHQLFALATFYFAFDGPNWANELNNEWLDPTKSECFWYSAEYGSFQDETNYVETVSFWTDRLEIVGSCDNETQAFHALSLEYLGLSPTFHPIMPPEIQLLSSLRVIRLFYSGINASLTDIITPEVQKMSQLEGIVLEDNLLTGTVPASIGQMTNLDSLFLGWNYLSGSIPTEIGLLSTNLINLDLAFGFLTSAVPKEVAYLTNLVYLGLEGNQLSGSLPELNSLTRLTSLSCSHNFVSGSLPTWLEALTELQYLYFDANSFSGVIPNELSSLANLTVLSLQYNQLTGPINTELGRLSYLDFLGLSGNQLTGTMPTSLLSLQNMTGLGLGENLLTGMVPTWLGNLTSLERVFIHRNHFTGLIPSELGYLRSVFYLDMEGNQFLDGFIPSEIGLMSSMEYMSLANANLTASIPTEIGMLSSLIGLLLHDNSLSGAIPSEFGKLDALEELYLSDLPLLTGSIPVELAAMGNLSGINLSGSTGLSGVVPESFCTLNDAAEAGCSFSSLLTFGQEKCFMNFSCTEELCGCDCPCLN